MSSASDADLLRWLQSAQKPAWSKDVTEIYYHTVSPRMIFLKSLPHGACVVDMGAGEGETAILRNWPEPKRPDLRLFAVSLEPASGFAAYEEEFIGDFEVTEPIFSVDGFDAVLCCHFVEHLQSFEKFAAWLERNLKPGGSAYIEWPHPISKSTPGLAVLKKAGFVTSTTNFFDDKTHVETWDLNDVERILAERGLDVRESGRIKFPYLSEQMRDRAVADRNSVMLTFAIWAHVGWAQYVVVERPQR